MKFVDKNGTTKVYILVHPWLASKAKGYDNNIQPQSFMHFPIISGTRSLFSNNF